MLTCFWLLLSCPIPVFLVSQASPAASQDLQTLPEPHLQKYIPVMLYPLLSASEWRECIVAQAPNVKQMDIVEARRAFMGIIIKLFPLYGSCFFYISVRHCIVVALSTSLVAWGSLSYTDALFVFHTRVCVCVCVFCV